MQRLLPLGLLLASLIQAQAPIAVNAGEPDAERTKQELSGLLAHYPPTLKDVIALDPGLLTNESYLATYPALTNFLRLHPEVIHNPSFYVGEASWQSRQERRSPGMELWENVLGGLAAFIGFGMAIGLVTWVIRTTLDYRRWNRLTKVQTEVHTRLLDRFTANEELLEYIKSTAGAKFLESAPISLDAGPHHVAAPLGRILWSVQAGVVLVAAGFGLNIVRWQVPPDAVQPLQLFGILGMSLGTGFVISAIVSFAISHRLGLIQRAQG